MLFAPMPWVRGRERFHAVLLGTQDRRVKSSLILAVACCSPRCLGYVVSFEEFGLGMPSSSLQRERVLMDLSGEAALLRGHPVGMRYVGYATHSAPQCFRSLNVARLQKK